MDRSTDICSRLPDIFEPDVYSGSAGQMASLNMLLAADIDIERMLPGDSPAARYSRRRIASCSAHSQAGSTVCSEDDVYIGAFTQSEEFLLLKDDCYDYPTAQLAATDSTGHTWRHRRRRSSAGKLRTMVSSIFRSKSNN
ncbi:hypothetical protein LPJ61_000070 [Coemansia biformis]|uniref:Uncharacterized protein n=1 Tax=Coemansia biformis TaxID=1286918 RepID=A0A9W7YJF4_9FUNG|nr:hypothetical protein LPJ61_000070 [Coemansia biformis]